MIPTVCLVFSPNFVSEGPLQYDVRTSNFHVELRGCNKVNNQTKPK